MSDRPNYRLTGVLILLSWGYLLVSPGIQIGAAEPRSDPLSAAQPVTAEALYRQGIQQFRARQLQAAIQSWQTAYHLYRQEQNLQAAGQTLENLGLAYRTIGDYSQAATMYQRQLVLVQQSNDRQSSANALANLGSVYRVLGNYQEALRFTQRSLELRRVLNDRKGEGLVLANLGNIQAELGKYETAIDLHQRSLAIAKEVQDLQGAVLSLNSLGALYAGQGDYRNAQQHYEESLKIAREIDFPGAVGSTLNNLGFVLHSQGNYAQAIDHYQQSFAIAQRLNDSSMLGTALAGLGLGYTSLADFARAMTYQQRGLDIAQKMGDRKLEGLTLSNMAYTLWRAGDLAKAEQHYRAALETLEALRLNLNDPDKVSIIDTQMVSYNNLLQVLIDRKQPEAALEVAERSRARAFVQLLSRRFGAQLKAITAKSRAALTEYPAPTLEQIRQIAKTQNATLVEYAIVPDSHFIAHGKLKGADVALLIWVVQPNGMISFRLVDLKPLQAQKLTVAALVKLARECMHPSFDCRSRLSQGAQTETPPVSLRRQRNVALHRLYQLLIEPIADLLPKDPEQSVIFVPQDALFLVPFPALQAANGLYLVEQHTPLTVPSIQVLALTRQVKQQRLVTTRDRDQLQPRSTAHLSPALIVGNPTMPEVNGKPLDALPESEVEANQIADLLKVKALVGPAANQKAVVQFMAQAKLIHLATHGLLEYGEELGETFVPGAIALAPPPSSHAALKNENGLLTASEIFDLRLQADLVVLSACDTGRGRITGDGVIGLSRAFIAAGVPSIIVSLWAVSDVSTADLMVVFYQQLLQQPNKAKALRQAMLDTMTRYPRPIDWAAFTLIGEAE